VLRGKQLARTKIFLYYWTVFCSKQQVSYPEATPLDQGIIYSMNCAYWEHLVFFLHKIHRNVLTADTRTQFIPVTVCCCYMDI